MHDLITKVSQVFPREDGSEARITVSACFGLDFTRYIDVFVHRRESPNHAWQLCSESPQLDPTVKTVDDLRQKLKEQPDYGRSEVQQAVTPGEILKLTSAIGQPMNYFES